LGGSGYGRFLRGLGEFWSGFEGTFYLRVFLARFSGKMEPGNFEKHEKHVIALEMAISKEIAIPQLLGTFYKRHQF